MIKIIGLGPGSPELLTVGALKLLKESKVVCFRTEEHPVVEYIREKNINFETYDRYYNNEDNIEKIHNKIALDIIRKYKNNNEEDIVYAVPGHPLIAESSVIDLIDICKNENIEYEVLPAVSFIDTIINRINIDPKEGLRILDSLDINNQVLDKRIATIITDIYNPLIASEVKLRLLDFYNDDTRIIYITKENLKEIPLYELDTQEGMSNLTAIYIPKDINNKRDIYDLINIISILRGESGCPWDAEQTHKTLRSAIIEESYEVADAIDQEDYNALVEELGDVLLHIIFHALIGKEDGSFELSDIINGICEKMIFRHPHVFKNDKLSTSKEVTENWEELKKREKGFETLTDELNGIARALPALVRANKVQKKAKKVGFDWDNVEDAAKKVQEELGEVLEVYKCNDKDKITEEVGDLLFSCVNVARFLDVDEEIALNRTIDKFIKRLSYIEEQAIKNNSSLTQMSLEDMDKFWEEAKTIK